MRVFGALGGFALVVGLGVGLGVACSASGGNVGGGGAGTGGAGGAAGEAGQAGEGGEAGQGGEAGGGMIDAGNDDSGGIPDDFVTDPKTCGEAEKSKSYVGCDYWPTVTGNNVWSIFDFAVAVANGGTVDAEVTVTGPNNVNEKVTVKASGLEVIYLPWVASLKGPDTDNCGGAVPLTATVVEKNGAYHLVSSTPVTVYQFNALEYKGAGGKVGKDWSSCPGLTECVAKNDTFGCFSFSNDASLLLPSTAMTGNYRVIGESALATPTEAFMPTYVSVTATQDGTEIEFLARGKVVAGGGFDAIAAGKSGKITLNAGDVIQLLGGNAFNDDLSGSLVKASKPVQVISGIQCRTVPTANGACDHLEESMFPAETLGKSYLVTVPVAPKGSGTVGQVVRIVGNVDGTVLHFEPAISGPGISGGKATINAGQVLDLGTQNGDFQVWSDDKEFMVATFQLGGSVVAPLLGQGDPSQSLTTAIEQYRPSYVFLAPKDYDSNWVNIIAKPGAKVTLDGQVVSSSSFTPVGASGVSVARVKLSQTGTHRITSDKPVGIQVYGYGSYTSYQYPGGLNLRSIAAPPIK